MISKNHKLKLWVLSAVSVTGVMVISTAAMATPITVLNASFDRIFSDEALTQQETVTTAGTSYYISRDAGTNAITGGGSGISGTYPKYLEGWYTENAYPLGTYSAMIDTHGADTRYWNTGEHDGAVLITQNNSSATTQGRRVVQTLSDTLAANTTYTLTVELGNWKSLATSYPFDPANVVVQLLVGGNALTASSSVTPTPGAGDFETWTFTFDAADNTALIGQTLGIRLGTTDSESTGYYTSFDNVALDATLVPEPATMAMLGLGGVMMLVRRRRNRK